MVPRLFLCSNPLLVKSGYKCNSLLANQYSALVNLRTDTTGRKARKHRNMSVSFQKKIDSFNQKEKGLLIQLNKVRENKEKITNAVKKAAEERLRIAEKDYFQLSSMFGSTGIIGAKSLAEFDPESFGVWRSSNNRRNPSRTCLCVCIVVALLLKETPKELAKSKAFAKAMDRVSGPKQKNFGFCARTIRQIAKESGLHHWKKCSDNSDEQAWHGAFSSLEKKGIFKRSNVIWGLYYYRGVYPKKQHSNNNNN